MSKSDWKELPDWTKPGDYAFLNDAALAVWAWEFLRRNDDYRQDWSDIATKKYRYHYSPPMLAGEDEGQWAARAMYELDVDHIKTLYRKYIAKKWGVQQCYDPNLPYHPSIGFIKPGSEFPRLILMPDEFDALVVTEETDSIPHVAYDYAVIAFDIKRSFGKQVEAAAARFQQRKQYLQKHKLVKPDGHGNKAHKWIRHIRVLDALRSTPRPTAAIIAKTLGGKKSVDATKEQQFKEGDKFVSTARAMMNGGYRKILLSKGTPGKITP